MHVSPATNKQINKRLQGNHCNAQIAQHIVLHIYSTSVTQTTATTHIGTHPRPQRNNHRMMEPILVPRFPSSQLLYPQFKGSAINALFESGFGGLQTPPTPLVSNRQHLAGPPPPPPAADVICGQPLKLNDIVQVHLT